MKPKKKKLQTKVVDSMVFGIHRNTFFQQTLSFPKFSVKISYEKISGIRSDINFNYT